MGGALSAVGHDAGAVAENPSLGTVYRVGQWEGSLAQSVAKGKAQFGVPALAYTHIFQKGSNIISPSCTPICHSVHSSGEINPLIF
jgi:hypothetical protein